MDLRAAIGNSYLDVGMTSNVCPKACERCPEGEICTEARILGWGSSSTGWRTIRCSTALCPLSTLWLDRAFYGEPWECRSILRLSDGHPFLLSGSFWLQSKPVRIFFLACHMHLATQLGTLHHTERWKRCGWHTSQKLST